MDGGSPAATSSLAATWPLLGREAELERIEAARADDGCPGVVIAPRPGVGKSRLAREAAAAAERDGAMVGWVQATRSAAAIPLARSPTCCPPTCAPTTCSSSCAAAPPPARPRRAGGRSCRRRRRAVARSESAALCCSSPAPARVRRGDGPQRRAGPDAITSLWKDAGAPRLSLQPLDEARRAALVEQALGGPSSRPRRAGSTRAARATRSTSASSCSGRWRAAASRSSAGSGAWSAARR